MHTEGAYFIVADVSAFLREGETDEAFAKRLTVEAGVTTIPVSRSLLLLTSKGVKCAPLILSDLGAVHQRGPPSAPGPLLLLQGRRQAARGVRPPRGLFPRATQRQAEARAR